MFVNAPYVPWNGSAYRNTQVVFHDYDVRYDGFVKQYTGGYTSVGVGTRHRAYCTKTQRVGGWRHPTAYWSAAYEFIPKSYDLKIKLNHWFYGTDGYKRYTGQPGIGSWGGSAGQLGPLGPEWWFGASGFSVQSYDQNAYNRCITEALLNIADRKVNLSETFGELATSRAVRPSALLDYLGQAVTKVASAWKSLRNGNVRLAIRHLGLRVDSRRVRRIIRNFFGGSGDISRRVATAWLQLQYAWKPILADIFGTVETLQESLPKLTFTVRRRIVAEPAPRPAPLGYSVWDYQVEGKVFVETKLFGKIRDSDIAELQRWTSVDPRSVAWELMPYSFVIDWLLPIGNFLQAASSTLGTEFVSGYTTYGLEAVERCTYWKNTSGMTVTSVEGTYPSAQARVRCVKRDRHYTWPYWLPYVKNPFSTHHVANALALLRVLR